MGDLPATISVDHLRSVCVSILESAQVPAGEASAVAESLVRAEARGQASHGVMRLDTYVRRVKQGLIRIGVPPELVYETPATGLIDAHAGFGHVVGLHAIDICVSKAERVGVGAVAVRNSTHFGVACVFAERAAEQGCIGIATSNAAARMPPVGAKTAVLGTNPLAIAVPGDGGGIAFVLDMSTSVVALGKILTARDERRPIPEGWALDSNGAPTTDPAVAADGLMLPMAGPKGFGLALALEVLSAVLSGSPPGLGAGSMYRTWDRPEGLGHFFLALSVRAFQEVGSFDNAMANLVAQVRGAEPSTSNPILLPGEIEARKERLAQLNGIPMTQQLASSIQKAAQSADAEISL